MSLYFQGGDDTSPNVLSFALLFMVRNREVLERVQVEVDAVLGNRSPRLGDRQRLPYTQVK